MVDLRSITFRKDFGLWWPDYDHKPEKCFGKVMRDVGDMGVAIKCCRQKRLCVQAGGHAGVWPLRLAQYFEMVYTFEAEPALYECLTKNIKGNAHIVHSPAALGAFVGEVKLCPKASAGSWCVGETGTVAVPQTTIDLLKLPYCDAIFLDVEGYEVEALQGAALTISRHRPVIMVEELPRSKVQIEAHLDSLGYKFHKQVHSDYVYVP